jgi:hypothetical protein
MVLSLSPGCLGVLLNSDLEGAVSGACVIMPVSLPPGHHDGHVIQH